MTQLAAHWEALAEHARRLSGISTQQFFAQNSLRAEQLSFQLGALSADFSRQRIDDGALQALIVLAQNAGVESARKDLFSGEPINNTENRAVLHTALRAQAGDSPASDVLNQAIGTAQAGDQKMQALAVHWSDPQQSTITDLIHVGIGGSDLGPRLVYQALRHQHSKKIRLHFLTNVDAHEAFALIETLNPKTTAVCVVSKSFTTQETHLNLALLLDWLAPACGGQEKVLTERVVAVTANTKAANVFGIPEAHVLPMWDWVGGRYSVWSSVAFSLCCALGADAIAQFRAGARIMDQHFLSAPLVSNIPMLLALVGIWNRNILNCPVLAVIPYDSRLALLPEYLQQLEMESNGKGVDRNGDPLTHPTVPVILGGVGTNCQHAFFQSFHQGLDDVPIDFIGVIRPDHTALSQHNVLLAHLLAQSSALAFGTDAETSAQAHKTCRGNRPNSLLLLDQLTPAALGELLALYEHKVFVQGWIWNVNSFDQFGVELGKSLANTILPVMRDAKAAEHLDLATQSSLIHIRRALAAS